MTMEREALTLETLAMAQAAQELRRHRHRPGGARRRERHASPQAGQDSRHPGRLRRRRAARNHQQTFAAYNPAYTGEIKFARTSLASSPLNRARSSHAARPCPEDEQRWSTSASACPREWLMSRTRRDILDLITLTVEPGGIGGIPASGLSFGAVAMPKAIIDQPAPVRLLRWWRPGPGLSWDGGGRRRWQRQREPLRVQDVGRRRVHQYFPDGQGGLLHGNVCAAHRGRGGDGRLRSCRMATAQNS